LLRYARDGVLDAMGERTDTIRLQAQKSKTTLRFTLSDAQTFDITIPQGTRATPDGKLYFATTSMIVIKSGQTYGDAPAQSNEGGELYNNFAPGQIKTIVDPISYVANVQNIETSSGVSDIESDDSYRERIREAPSSFSTAGPEDAYKYWAKSANVDIADIAVTSPSEGRIKITVLMKNGQLPMQNVLDSVNAACSKKKRRPLTDFVTVSAPTVVNYNINLTYYISKLNNTEETNIKYAVGGTITSYNSWQSEKLGREINPDYLRQLMLNAGAYKIDLTSPVYTSINEDAVAKASSNITVTYGGLI